MVVDGDIALCGVEPRVAEREHEAGGERRVGEARREEEASRHVRVSWLVHSHVHAAANMQRRLKTSMAFSPSQ